MLLKLFAFFVSVFFFATAATATSTCRAHDPRAVDVPECPANGSTLLPDSYPAMAVSVSDELGGSEFVTDFVTKVLRAQPDLPPQFFLNVSAETLAQAKKAVRAATADDPNRRAKWLAALTLVKGERFNWQQDFMQNYVGADGRPVPRELGHYRIRGRQFDALRKAYRQNCDVKAGATLFPARVGYVDGFSGGNIEGGPNGICLLGKDSLSRREFTDYKKRVCGGGTLLEVPSEFLEAGHTDEITSTVRTGPGECDFAMLIASPRAALEAMRADPEGEAFAILDSRDGKALVLESRLLGICKKHIEISSGTRPGLPAEPRAIPEKSGGLIEKILFGDRANAKLPPRGFVERCRKMTNLQFLAALQADRDLLRVNEMIDEQMDRFRKSAETAWRKVAPHCPQRIVDWPTLYAGRLVNRGKDVDEAGSLLPNVNNLQQFGQTLMIPDPGSETLRLDLRKRAEALGLKAEFLNTNIMQINAGNLHCSTNTLRYCRPRAELAR
jgi:hypothetical protein